MDDAGLLELFLAPIRRCAKHTAKLGGDEEVTLETFHLLYGQDVFYSLIGLNNDLMYAAHRAAGGMTSIYRQIGVGSELLFRQIASDALGLELTQLDWSYDYAKDNGKVGVHELDCRIRLEFLTPDRRERFMQWIDDAKKTIGTGQDGKFDPDGVVFEVRQGYKSADSKRQFADLRYAGQANRDRLLPVVFLMSDQMNRAVIERYRRGGLLVTTGVIGPDPCLSSFSLVNSLFDFDLLAFFQRHRDRVRTEVHEVVKSLLTAR